MNLFHLLADNNPMEMLAAFDWGRVLRAGIIGGIIGGVAGLIGWASKRGKDK